VVRCAPSTATQEVAIQPGGRERVARNYVG
jgi:hypothetical protein